MGCCKNVCDLRRYDQGISAISERGTQTAGVDGDFSEQTVYAPVFEDAFFVVWSQTMANVAWLSFTLSTALVPTSILSVTAEMIRIANVGQRTPSPCFREHFANNVTPMLKP